MTFTDELWWSITPTYDAILAHPFLTGLTDGTLHPDAFAFYLCQDALYLGRYAQALAVLGGRAPEAGDVAMFARHAAGAIEVERHTCTSHCCRSSGSTRPPSRPPRWPP